MASSSSSLLVFKVQRGEPQLIVPATPTPYEFKYLSDIDDQKGLRFQIPSIIFYRNVVGLKAGRDPVKVIREGIAKALVYYYPFAGRLREGPNAKLMVECTGEGVLFIEADANVMLDQFGELLQPPFPCMDDLLYDAPGSSGVLNCPLLLIQVTRLLCGGFIVAIRLNRTMTDAPGLIQFLTAVTEMGGGACVPSIRPIWKRELLNARNPPQVSCKHYVYEALPDSKGSPLLNDMVQAQSSFFFGPKDIAVLRSKVPPHLRKCSRFEIITACLWRCRTMSLNLNPNDEVRLAFVVNSRTLLNLPVGFYGSAFGLPAALSTAGKLCQNPLGYALELVKNAKADGTEEFMKSTTDLLVKNGRLQYVSERTYFISDVTNVGFTDIDFGWGRPVYSGPTGAMPLVASFLVPLQNKKGENGIVATINLPVPSMDKLFKEITEMIKEASSRNMSIVRPSL